MARIRPRTLAGPIKGLALSRRRCSSRQRRAAVGRLRADVDNARMAIVRRQRATMSQRPAAHALTFPLFGPLDAADSAALTPLLRPRRYEAGRLVFQRGDAAEEVFLVVAGQLRVSVCSVDGRELAFRIALPGDIVG